ncbi:hypothetical protein LSH36_469g00017 [Paralvinella palmiformis]|uniref:DDE Tnp4 domain-containing protein n=1 Tax=Paralvinella palmiformis TaxID=53620 RepID=A0AAD9JA80_9ANNE|nr:hypothetical protein LSH36_469g00017 [Paralvinella palmiformis]
MTLIGTSENVHNRFTCFQDPNEAPTDLAGLYDDFSSIEGRRAQKKEQHNIQRVQQSPSCRNIKGHRGLRSTNTAKVKTVLPFRKSATMAIVEDDDADDSHDNGSPTSDQEEGLIAVDEITIARLKAELEEKNKIIGQYKSNPTFKSLIGISPHGTVTFVSPLYTGGMSDVEITCLSGLVDLCEAGDSMMADKGFTIKNLLEAKGLNIPPFLQNKGRFSLAEVEKT